MDAPFGWRRGGLATRIFGPEPFNRQVHVHLCNAAADAFVAVSLAGSLFFSVSVDAARPRIILYLALTMAPFAVVAPLIGPLIDRVRGGHRLVLALACAGRVVLCLLMARDLRNLFFYPEAFAVLVLGKTYSVAKSALVPRLVTGHDDLVAANSRLSRVGTLGGMAAGPIAVGLSALGGARLSLGAAALIYLIGAVVSLRLPKPPPPAPVPPGVHYEELHSAAVVADATAMAALRASMGFLVLLLAFELKRSGEAVWLFGVLIVAGAVGGLAGTFLAPWLRQRYAEERLLSLALVAPALAALWAAATVDRFGLLAVALILGISANVGSQAFSSLLQRHAPEADRGRAFAAFETRFQLSWVGGSLVPVVLNPAAWVGLLVLGISLLLVAGIHLGSIRSRQQGERRRLDGEAMGRAASIGSAVLDEADRLLVRGETGQSILVARSALRAVAGAGDASAEARRGLEVLWQHVLDGVPIDAGEVATKLAEARFALDRAAAAGGRPQPASSSGSATGLPSTRQPPSPDTIDRR